MYTLNQIERRSSSSSSDEEVKCENHTNRHCKYLKIEILIAGELCYFHVAFVNVDVTKTRHPCYNVCSHCVDKMVLIYTITLTANGQETERWNLDRLSTN